MCETPKQKQEKEPNGLDSHDANSWEEDQKKHDYYYDDSHGYEIYVPDDSDEEMDVDTKPET